jgi:rhodanese-related sulfurtransferase
MPFPNRMLRLFITVASLVIAALANTACQKSDADSEAVLTIGRDGSIVYADQVDELASFDPTTQQLIYHLTLAQAEEFVRRFPGSMVFDIRSREQYEAGHLPGAPHADWLYDKDVFQMLVGEMPKSDKYLVYGSTAMVADTAEAIVRLRSIGFQNLHTFYESYDAWQGSSLPFEQGPDPEPLTLPDPPSEEYVEGVSEPDLKDHWDMWDRSKAYVEARDGKPADAGATTPAAGAPPAADADGNEAAPQP